MEDSENKFSSELREMLQVCEKRLGTAKEKLESASQETESTIRKKLEEVRATLNEKAEDVQVAKVKLQDRLEAKKAELQSEIQDWKEKREKEKLLSRADRKEDQAAAAVLFALVAFEEAEEAILEAIEARMQADAAQAD